MKTKEQADKVIKLSDIKNVGIKRIAKAHIQECGFYTFRMGNIKYYVS